MQNAVVRVGIDEVALDNEVVTSMSTAVSHRLDDWKVTNQKKSGRCWLFAALNLIRSGTRRKLGLKDFEFSQNYAMYYDKLERANYFFESIIETADQEPDDRLVAFLMANVLDDGGQWDMIVNLFTKHGVVPKSVMPETQVVLEHRPDEHHPEDPGPAGRCRACASWSPRAPSADELQAAKHEILADVHAVLSIHLGTPPAEFDWQWIDDEKQFHRDGELTPQEFYAKYVDIDLDEYVCLVDDPREEHAKGETLTVEHLGNVVGGRPVLLPQRRHRARQAARDGDDPRRRAGLVRLRLRPAGPGQARPLGRQALRPRGRLRHRLHHGQAGARPLPRVGDDARDAADRRRRRRRPADAAGGSRTAGARSTATRASTR